MTNDAIAPPPDLPLDRLNILDGADLADPYGLYRQLREREPVHRTSGGLWVLTRYADVTAVLRDPRFGREGFERHFAPANGHSSSGAGHRQSMLFRDPPHHTRLRDAVSRAFTPRAVETLRPRIQAHVDVLLDRVALAGRMDVVADLAEPLPRAVIGELLGIPEAHRAALAEWSAAVARSLDALPIPEDRPLVAEGQTARRALGGYVRELIASRRAQPESDLVSTLVEAADQDGLLTDSELVAMIVLLLVAGTETTVSLIGTTVWALLRHPDELARLREAPWLLPAAVEEAARWESPVQRTWRIATTEVEIAGHRMPAGALVVLLLGAANRDPARFAEPGPVRPPAPGPRPSGLRRRGARVPGRLSRPPRDPGRGQRAPAALADAPARDRSTRVAAHGDPARARDACR